MLIFGPFSSQVIISAFLAYNLIQRMHFLVKVVNCSYINVKRIANFLH